MIKQGLRSKYAAEHQLGWNRKLNNQKGHIDPQIKTVKLKPLNENYVNQIVLELVLFRKLKTSCYFTKWKDLNLVLVM